VTALKSTIVRAAAIVVGLSIPAAGQGLDKVKACFVYLGPIDNSGWTYQHHLGALSAKAGLGDRVELVEQDNVPDDPSAVAVIENFARSGCNIIFTTSFGFMDQTNAVAAKYPNVMFEHSTGYKRDTPNVSTYNARFYEGRAVEGLLAGRMTRTNKIGYVASFPIPEVLAGINAYYLAAKTVNPDVELEVRWVYTWFNPEVEGEAAKSMIDAGVDVIAAHTDSTATLQEAAKTGGSVLGFGQASDMTEFGPSPRISAIVNNWGPYYFERISALLNGTYTQSDTFKGMSQAVLVGLITDEVPKPVKEEAEALRDALASGKTSAFVGPIKRQDGSVWLKEGELAPDADILGMNFLVEGITAELPK
jgi:basic membrane protein A and related proteins